MKQSLAFVAVLLPLILSCRTTTAPNTETADVIGRAELLGRNGWLASNQGVTVTVENTSFSAVTDDSGMFEFKGIPEGTYNIHYSKPGFGDVYWYGKSIQGGGNAPVYWTEKTSDYNSGTVGLIQHPNLVATIQAAKIFDSAAGVTNAHLLEISGFYAGADTQLVAIYFSHHSNVSSVPGTYEGYRVTYHNMGPGLLSQDNLVFNSNAQTFVAWLRDGDLSLANFHSGDSVYVACYGNSWAYQGGNSTFEGDYYDAIHRTWVLTCIDQTPSPVIGLKIP